MLSFPRLIFQQIRLKHNWKGGWEYPGFTYYPRHPDQKDPPYQPTKLLRVQRIKPMKNLIYYEKDALVKIGLIGRMSDVAIVKNTPEQCALLWLIKHIVKISPITFPNGFPDENNINGSFLKENGEFWAGLKPYSYNSDRLQVTEEFEKAVKPSERLDGRTLRKDSRKKWNAQ